MVLETLKSWLNTLLSSQVGPYVYPTAVIVAGASLADPTVKSPLDVPMKLVKSVTRKIF